MRTLSLLFVCVFLLPVFGQEKDANAFPPYPQAGGVSAPFAGFIGDTLIVAGGCNFPDTPAADGGKKVFHATAYALDVRRLSDGWIPLPPLPAPIAYGAAVPTPEGLVCIGGQNAQGAQTDVYLLGTNGQTTPLPPLPASVDNGGASLCGHTLLVTGGNQPENGKGLYALDLSSPTNWKRLADYPGPQRIQPIVLSTPNALYLAGGYAFDATQKKCTPSTDLLKYDVGTNRWSVLDTLIAERDGTPRCLAGGSGVMLSDGKMLLTGGVNHDIFRQAMEGKGPADYMKKPVAWYRFNDDLLTYDPGKRTWHITYDVPGLARAGGILLEHDGYLYIICGEIKPGIRTPQITVLPL